MNILHLTQTPLYSMTLSISSYLFNCHFHLLGIISQNKWANNNVHFYKKKKKWDLGKDMDDFLIRDYV